MPGVGLWQYYAKNLVGKLLLIHGEMDENVHFSLSMKVANELIKENKVSPSPLSPANIAFSDHLQRARPTSWNLVLTRGANVFDR